jgi:hypothetical protein
LLQFLFAAELDIMATPADLAEQKRRINSKAFAGEILFKKVRHLLLLLLLVRWVLVSLLLLLLLAQLLWLLLLLLVSL